MPRPFNSKFNYMSVADGRLFFLCPLVPRGTGCSGRLMPAGHLLFCATKKGDKKVAGNAIPRSRLPSDREIAHSRVGSLYPYFGYRVRHRKKYLFKPTLAPANTILYGYLFA